MEHFLQPRPNVLLEAGSAMATHPGRTIIVELGAVRELGNLAGRNVIRLTDQPEPLHGLRNRLKVAGCRMEVVKPDWDDPGRFAALAGRGRQTPSSHQPLNVAISDAPGAPPLKLQLMESGNALFHTAIAGRHAFAFGQPDHLKPEQVTPLAEFATQVADLGEVASELGPGDALRVGQQLSDQLDELRELGLVVYAGRRQRQLSGGTGPPLPWIEAHMRAFQAEDRAIVERPPHPEADA